MTQQQFDAHQEKVHGKVPNQVRRKGNGVDDLQEHKADYWPMVLRIQMISAGLPEPYREHVFHDTRNWRIDLAYPDRRLGIECDGGVHRIKARFLRDIEKHNALVMCGWRHIRVTPAMVRDGSALELVKVFIE